VALSHDENGAGNTGMLTRTTTRGDVTSLLRQRILAGHYPEEHFIRQEAIASELGVSRIPVREALAQLEAEGLIVHMKYRGSIVPKRSIVEISEIFELRLLIEPFLLRLAVPNIQATQLMKLRAIVEKSRKSKSLGAWTALNNILVRADRYLKMPGLQTAATRNESDTEHSRILELVAAGDTEHAIKALIGHIRWNADDMRQHLAAPLPATRPKTARPAKR
jgi:DNA-binding GntR family transcriptional regulator